MVEKLIKQYREGIKWYVEVSTKKRVIIKTSEGSQTHQPPQVPTWLAQKHPSKVATQGRSISKI